MKIRLNKNSRLHRANREGGFAGISVASAIALGASVAGVAATGLSIANQLNGPDLPSGRSGSVVAPDQQYFLQQQELLAEYAAQKQAQDSTRAANYAYEQAETSKAFFTYAAVLGAAAIGYVILKKNKIL